MKTKKILTTAAVVLFIVSTLWLLQRLVVPKYMGDVVEGNFIAEYYDEEKDHIVVFLGDCEVYENFSPLVLWEEYGINAYIRGTAQQLVNQSYYVLEDTLKHETPDVVVFSVLAVPLNEPAKESYNRMTLDGLPWSNTKLDAILTSMTEEEQLLDYVFPLLRYHSRITELTGEDFKYLFHRDLVSHNGYYMRVDAKPATNIPSARPLADYTIHADQMMWLERIRALCEEKGVELVLVKAPSLYPHWYDQWDAQITEYAEKNDLLYVNLLAARDEIGLDFTTDTYDGGLHLNLAGAEKLSHYFGKILRDECGLESRRGEEALEDAWAEKKEWYLEEKAQQESSLKKS